MCWYQKPVQIAIVSWKESVRNLFHVSGFTFINPDYVCGRGKIWGRYAQSKNLWYTQTYRGTSYHRITGWHFLDLCVNLFIYDAQYQGYHISYKLLVTRVWYKKKQKIYRSWCLCIIYQFYWILRVSVEDRGEVYSLIRQGGLWHCNKQISQCTSAIFHDAPISNRNMHMGGHFCCKMVRQIHYTDVIMGQVASQITSKHQKTPKLRVTGLCAGNSPVTRKMFPFHDVIMSTAFINASSSHRDPSVVTTIYNVKFIIFTVNSTKIRPIMMTFWNVLHVFLYIEI